MLCTCSFLVDVGNGHVTLVPTVLFALCMTWDLLPARIMGIIGIILMWQMMYGECSCSCSWEGVGDSSPAVASGGQATQVCSAAHTAHYTAQ